MKPLKIAVLIVTCCILSCHSTNIHNEECSIEGDLDKNSCNRKSTHRVQKPFLSLISDYINEGLSYFFKLEKSKIQNPQKADTLSFEVEDPVQESSNKEGEDKQPANSEMEKFGVKFTNLSPFRTSLYWYEDEELHRIADVIQSGESIDIGTYEGHQFVFSREGTRDQIGDILTVTKSIREYSLPKDAKPKEKSSCEDRYPKKCESFASAGECQKNPGWMIVNCPVACDTCDLLDQKKRCSFDFLNTTSEHVWKPGDLNALFEKIITRDDMETVVLSQPPSGPWVVQFENLLSEKEITALVAHGKRIGFARSTDTGEANDRGETSKVYSSGRTSSNAWCTESCEQDPIIQGITEKIVDITKIPAVNYEQFQILEYQVGQEYRSHHDMSPKDEKKAGGVRILTFFLYLSDVEEGGGTHFPNLDVTVQPKRGRAVLWPSVLDASPYRQDSRTMHAALPVKQGVKYAANHWIHSHNFRIANLWGCTGSFD